MPPGAQQDTRTALVEAATDLIQVQGFCAFSYQDLSDRIGIRKASVHHHFPGKADLGVAVVEAMAARLRAVWRDVEAAHPDLPGRLGAVFAHVRALACDGRRICPIGALHAEFNALPKPVQRAVRAFDVEYVAIYASWLDQGRRRGEAAFPGTAQAMAQVLTAVLQAALQRHRSNPAESVDDTLDQFLALIAA